MSANANGTPTSLGIPTFNPAQDIAGPLGVNEMVQSIDSKIAGRMFAPSAPTDKQVVKWSQAGGAWVAGFVAPSELAQEGATDGQALIWSTASGKWIPKGVGLQYRKTTLKAVNTTIAATDLLNSEITVAAGAMGATGMLRLTAWGDFLNNTGGAVAGPRIQLLLGGTTIFDTNALNAFTSTTGRNAWDLTAEILNISASSQSAHIERKLYAGAGLTAGQTTFTTGTGGGTTTANGFIEWGVNSGLAINTALAQALVLNVINGSASASYETKLFGALVEII